MMRNTLLPLFLVFFIPQLNAQVGVGTTTPAPSAQLDISSVSKGFLPPRMTLAQRDAVVSPAAGLQIWCTNCGHEGEMQVYNGSRWANMIGGIAAALPIPGVTIGGEVWMTKNLDLAFYRNGDSIPKVTDAAVWSSLTTGAYCYYNNDSATYAALYGKLYNWYAVNDPRGLAPSGWHIPNHAEQLGLETLAGGPSNAGAGLKATGTMLWSTPNTGANNSTGFTALPGGCRSLSSIFFDAGFFGYFWTAKEETTTTAKGYYLSYNNATNVTVPVNKKSGFSVRCIRD